jgi:hypothetical protein
MGVLELGIDVRKEKLQIFVRISFSQLKVRIATLLPGRLRRINFPHRLSIGGPLEVISCVQDPGSLKTEAELATKERRSPVEALRRPTICRLIQSRRETDIRLENVLDDLSGLDMFADFAQIGWPMSSSQW